MELRSFISGMLLVFAVESLMPFAGIKVTVSTPSPVISLVIGLGSLALIYVLQKHG